MRVCTIEGCGKKHYGLGLCRLCYQRKKATEPEFIAKRRVKANEYYAKDRERLSPLKRLWAHFFSEQDVIGCRDLQHGRCALCCITLDTINKRGNPQGENADHCHKSKTPRGLLCGTCNKALGAYEKHQRRAGLIIEPYEQYLANTPVMRLRAREAAE